MARCEDFPCCGHTPQDPCERQPYDEPGFFDTRRPGNEHALCDHENGECDVDFFSDDDEDDQDLDGRGDTDTCPEHGEQDVLAVGSTGGADPYGTSLLRCRCTVACFGPGEPNVVVGHHRHVRSVCPDCEADPEGICAKHDAEAEDAFQATYADVERADTEAFSREAEEQRLGRPLFPNEY